MRYTVVQMANGCWGVKDSKDPIMVAVGLRHYNAARKFADRMNLRDVWGI